MADNQLEFEQRQAGAHSRAAVFRHCVTSHSGKNTDFILSGFHQEDGIRYYIFERISDDSIPTEFTVDADVRLLGKYGIALQELPLLCRHLLEKQSLGSPRRAVTFSEDLMKEQADQRAALKQAAQEKKKAYRRLRPAHLRRDRR